MYILFATLLIYKGITGTLTICNKFANHFFDNLPYQLQNLPNIPEDLIKPHHDYNLFFLSKLLKESEKTLQ